MDTVLDEVFEDLDFSQSPLPSKNFEGCTFVGCRFTGLNLSAHSFVECEFENCDLSNIDVTDTSWQECTLQQCKIMGVRFDAANSFLFSIEASNCNFQYSNFYGRNLKSSRFSQCDFTEVDFGDADASGISLTQCNFQNAIWENTRLEKANLSGAENLTLDPESNFIIGMTLPKDSALNLLAKYKLKFEG
ncbi:MAG: pentapeptide repeat-containing protein [Schleiferiaceae bacterium]